MRYMIFLSPHLTQAYVPNLEAIYQSGNRYVYGLNNPLKYKDSSGNIALVDDAAIALVLATGVLIIVTYALHHQKVKRQ